MAKSKQTGARRKPQSRSSNTGRAPAWLLVLSGLLPGLFIAYLVHMHHERDGGVTEIASGSSAGDGDTQQTDEGNGRPRFEFYELLSEMEVVVPDESEPEVSAVPPGDDTPMPAPDSETPAAPAPQPESEPDDDAQYMVQAGSFRSHEDADRLKARLALMGVQADIHSVEVDGGETWHRVRIGPFADRGRVEAIRGRLEDENVDSILLRMRG